MSNVPLNYLPGVCKSNSSYLSSVQSGGVNGRSASGRFTAMDKVRFVAGSPEKLGGATIVTGGQMTGAVRGLHDWRDNNQVIYLGAGTSYKLYYYSNNVKIDITPLRNMVSGVLTNPFDVVMNSTTIKVHHTAHGLATGDYVKLSAGSSIGGITVAGVYTAINVLDANTYTITSISASNSTANGGGGSVSYVYYRITLSSPFTTTLSSTTVTVAHTNNGVSIGDHIIISGASAVGGITPSGEVVVTSASQNSYTFTWTSAATSGATGGGSPNFLYELPVGLLSSYASYGYGTGGYGQNGYGTTGTSSITLAARTWCLSNYGQQLLSNPSGGTIYVWDPIISGYSYPLYNAPTTCLAMFVTPERFVMALGVNGNAMQVAWPDQNDYTNWTSTPTNTANSGRTLQEGSYLVNGIAVRDGVSLVYSNTACYTFSYSGDNEIYATQIAGKGCGLIGALACAVIGGVAYWMSGSDFWSWNGTVQPLPSDDIRDYVFQDLDTTQQQKCVCGTNIAKREIIFLYPSLADATSEISRYVIYHLDQNCWSSGSFVLTSYLDKNLYSNPIAANFVNPNSDLWYMDSGTDLSLIGTDNPTLTFSPIDISKGDKGMDVFSFIPDFQRQSGAVNLTLYSQAYPQSTQITYGPYTIASGGANARIDLRANGNLIGYKLNMPSSGGDFRLGLPRLEVQPSGARR